MPELGIAAPSAWQIVIGLFLFLIWQIVFRAQPHDIVLCFVPKYKNVSSVVEFGRVPNVALVLPGGFKLTPGLITLMQSIGDCLVVWRVIVNVCKRALEYFWSWLGVVILT